MAGSGDFIPLGHAPHSYLRVCSSPQVLSAPLAYPGLLMVWTFPPGWLPLLLCFCMIKLLSPEHPKPSRPLFLCGCYLLFFFHRLPSFSGCSWDIRPSSLASLRHHCHSAPSGPWVCAVITLLQCSVVAPLPPLGSGQVPLWRSMENEWMMNEWEIVGNLPYISEFWTCFRDVYMLAFYFYFTSNVKSEDKSTSEDLEIVHVNSQLWNF